MILNVRKFMARRRVQQLIRDGVGVRETRWELPPPTDEAARTDLAKEIVTWVQDSMGTMRRPNGIDQVALALACRDAEGRVLRGNAFGVSRRSTYYAAEGAAQVESFLDALRQVDTGEGSVVLGALLSLGDLAHRMDLGRAA